MEKFLLAARSAGIGGARRRAVKNCLGGVSVFYARRSFIRRVAQVECSSDAWRRCIWRVASVVELLPARGANANSI
ncbi:hypothetical protein A2U01_0028356 [Trifolium medium]|uniref:Uncharacterized protein n=1 Tax=Trifolium medium TaxID=97028 RepID=A0A392P7A9_9FABA|nr:hypothetical protein [Trifolium medium]